MKNKTFKQANLRRQLQQYKNMGKKELVWKLSYEQIQIIKELGYKIEPYLYEITTRPFFGLRNIKSPLIRDIHYKNKQGKRTFIRKLNNNEKQILEDFGVKYRTIKYKIHLV